MDTNDAGYGDPMQPMSAAALSNSDTIPSDDAYIPEHAIGKDNIADMFSDAVLADIGSKVTSEYKTDVTNFLPRKMKMERIYNLLLQVPEIKNYPFDGAANVKYPLLTKACIQFAALAYPAIVKNDEVVKYSIVGKDDGTPLMDPLSGKPMVNPDTNKPIMHNAGAKARRGERVCELMNYQILEESDNWCSDTDRLLMVIPAVGQCFRKWYYDSTEKKECSRLVLPQHLVVNIDAPTLEGASRISEEFELYPYEIEENINLGLFIKFDYGTSNESLGNNTLEFEVSGARDADKPHIFIEQLRRLDLDNDGYAEPYTVIVHKKTSKVCRIIPRFEKDDIEYKITDKGRYEVARIKGWLNIVKYGFLPNPEGSFYDLGYGDLLYPINDAMNTSINQLFDAGHMSVLGGGFLGKGLRLKSGNLRFRPMEWKIVDTVGGKIKDNVVQIPTPQPSPVVMQLVDYLGKAGEDIAALNKMISGELPTNMPATTTMAAVEQSMVPFKAVFKRVYAALKREFKILYDLNSKNLDDKQYSDVLGEPASLADFNTKDCQIVPVSDLDMMTNVQRMAKANVIAGFKDDPFFNPTAVRKEILIATGYNDVDQFLVVPPPQKPGAAELAALAQAKMFDAQTAKITKELGQLDVKQALDIETEMADITQKLSTAELNLAKATAQPHETDLAYVEAATNRMEMQTNGYANIARTVAQLAAPANNQISAPIPE